MLYFGERALAGWGSAIQPGNRPLQVAAKIPEGRRSHQGHGQMQLLDQQRETPCDSVCAAYRQSVQIRSPDQDGVCPAEQSFQGVGAAPVCE